MGSILMQFLSMMYFQLRVFLVARCITILVIFRGLLRPPYCDGLR